MKLYDTGGTGSDVCRGELKTAYFWHEIQPMALAFGRDFRENQRRAAFPLACR